MKREKCADIEHDKRGFWGKGTILERLRKEDTSAEIYYKQSS